MSMQHMNIGRAELNPWSNDLLFSIHPTGAVLFLAAGGRGNDDDFSRGTARAINKGFPNARAGEISSAGNDQSSVRRAIFGRSILLGQTDARRENNKRKGPIGVHRASNLKRIAQLSR